MDKKNYSIHCRLLMFYVRHGMIVDRIRETFLFKQNKGLEKYRSFNTQKRILPRTNLEKDFFTPFSFSGKTEKC